MERVSFNIEREELVEALHAEAAAHGRSVEEEALALVEQGLAGKVKTKSAATEGNWVQELIELAGGPELRVPEWRGSERIAPAYPAGMEPLPGESLVAHISRISRPGFDLEIEHDREPHKDPRI